MISELLLVHIVDSSVFSNAYAGSPTCCILSMTLPETKHGEHGIKLRWSLPWGHVLKLFHDLDYVLWKFFSIVTLPVVQSLYVALNPHHIRLSSMLLLRQDIPGEASILGSD